MEKGKIRVYGKAQNRTALGIVKAYIVLHPNATLADLKQAFPDSLNPDSGVKINFITEEEVKAREGGEWNGYFTKEDEMLQLADGTKIAVVSMWTKPSFHRIIDKAEEYGIEIGEYSPADKSRTKGGYWLEYINGFDPEAKPKKKGCFGMLVLLIAVAGVAGYAITTLL